MEFTEDERKVDEKIKMVNEWVSGILGVSMKDYKIMMINSGFKMKICGEFQGWIKERVKMKDKFVKKVCPLNKRGRVGVLRMYRYKDRKCHAVVGSNGGVQILGAKTISETMDIYNELINI